jgi:hypothetical protein
MSYEIIQSIKSNLATIKQGVDDDTRAVAGNGGTNKRISIKGGVFRKYAGGKEVGAIEDRFMNVIFVKMAHNPARTYYAQGYQDGAKISPVCWTSDSKTPDEDVKAPQAPACDKCPHSAKNSGSTGMGTACRLQWRTAVVLPNDPSGDVMQLVLPATSVFGKEESGKFPFRSYVQMLANNNISAGRVVTRMQFDTKSPVPKLLFSPVDAVSEADIDTVVRQSKTATAENAIRLTVYQMDEGEAPIVARSVEEEVTQVEDEDGPKLRPTKKAESENPTADIPDVIKRWGKKK